MNVWLDLTVEYFFEGYLLEDMNRILDVARDGAFLKLNVECSTRNFPEGAVRNAVEEPGE